MQTIQARKKEVERELMEYLVNTTPYASANTGYDFQNFWERVSDMASKFKIDKKGCEYLISAYENLLKYDKTTAATYRSYINNTSGSIDFQVGIASANDLSSDARYVFSYTFPARVSDILMSRYYDLLNSLKAEDITKERLQEMFKYKVDMTKLNNKPLIWMYNSYIRTTEKKIAIKEAMKKINELKQPIKELDEKYAEAVAYENRLLSRLSDEYAKLSKLFDEYIKEFRLKKEEISKKNPYKKGYKLKEFCNRILDSIKPKSKKIKIEKMYEHPLKIQEWDTLHIKELSVEQLSDNDLKIDENGKRVLMGKMGISSLPPLVFQLYEEEKTADKTMESVFYYIDYFKNILKSRYDKYEKSISSSRVQASSFKNDNFQDGMYCEMKKRLHKVATKVSYLKRHNLKKEILTVVQNADANVERAFHFYGKDYIQERKVHKKDKDSYVTSLDEIRKDLEEFNGNSRQTTNQVVLENPGKSL